MEQITPRPQLYKTDYKNIGLVLAASFVGTLLALGVLMLFGRMLVKKQMNDLAKLDIPQPQPYRPQMQKVPQPDESEAVTVEVKEVQNIAEQPADTTKERPRLNGRFIKRQTDSN